MDTVYVGDIQTFTATTYGASGAILTGRSVTWSSLSPLVASVTASGGVTGVLPGLTNVLASSEGQTATVTVVVLPQPVARVAFADTALSRDVGETAASAVVVLDRRGASLTGRPIAFASTAPAIASVDPTTGIVTAVTPGTATISASVDGVTGTLRFTVRPPAPVARVAFPNGTLTVDEGTSFASPAATYDSLGRPLPGRPITYATSASAVATVDAAGRITGVAAGTATITATSEGQRGTVAVTVYRLPVGYVRLEGAPYRTIGVGDTLRLAATAYSSGGTPLPGRPVTYVLERAGFFTVDATTGLVRATAPGFGWIYARAEGKEAMVGITVEAAAPATLAVSPAAVSLGVGRTVALTVSAADRSGQPTAIGPVTFASSDAGVATVDASGRVTAVAAGTATIRATAGQLSATALVTVVAAPVSGFAIDVRFVSAAGADVQAAARQAAARWAEVIVGGLTPHRVDYEANGCGLGAPAIHETVQHLLVLVRIDQLDGTGGTLATAGPCAIRDGNRGLPSVGMVTIDSVDLRRFLTQGSIGLVQDVVAHEIGHVLGIGTLWNAFGVRSMVPNLPLGGADTGADLYYVGDGAVRAAGALGFATGAGVPVENGGGGGTRGSHWRESVFASELMTGYIGARNPLSVITIGSLRDLGYVVAESMADPFSPALAPTGGARATKAAMPTIHLNEQVLVPRRVRDPLTGRVRWLPPPRADASRIDTTRRGITPP